MRIECPHCQARVRVDDPEDDSPIRCPECRKKFAPPDPDDDDRRPARRKGGGRKPREEEKSAGALPWILAGGAVAVAAVVGVVVVVMSGGSKPEPKPAEVAVNNPAPPTTPPRPPAGVNPNPTPPRPTPQPAPGPTPGEAGPGVSKPTIAPGATGQRPPGPVTALRPTSPAPGAAQAESLGQYAELFSQPVNAPPRTVRAASLRPTSADKVPEIPTFHSLMLARKSAGGATPPTPKGAKLTLDEVKRACAYIKVDAGDLSSTGSGYLIGSDGKSGLIATNYHVIEAAAGPRFGAKAATVTTVFNSGQADEKTARADIVAYDPVADLAVLRVDGAGPWPKAINPYNALPKLVEGTAIQFWGFPLGDILSSGRKNPEITLGTGTVASLRHSASGKLDRVQISGTMNPGNSGGPLVDADGRLVGTAVSIINPKIGTGIGFAVPVDDLIALLEGRLLTTIFVPVGLEGGRAKFLVFVPVMDPLDRVDTVFIRRWAGIGKPPEAVRDPLTGYKPFAMRKDGKANLPGVEEFPLKKFRTEGGSASGLGIALGEMDVPQDAESVLIQVASQTFPNPQTGAKLTAASQPVGYTLAVGDQPVGADARPFDQLTGNPDGLAGQVVVVKGRVAAPPITRDAVQDLVVVSLDGRRPDRMRFLVDRAAAAEFDEVVPEHQPMPVRLVCVVGRRDADGVVPVRVARLDFIGRGDRIVRTIPSAPGPDDKLAALNRNPSQFAGQTVELTAPSIPLNPRALQANEYSVLFPSQAPPRNLVFAINPSIRQRLIESLGSGLRPGAIVRSRVTVVVPDRPVAPGGRASLTVTKIEFLDEDGRVARTIE